MTGKWRLICGGFGVVLAFTGFSQVDDAPASHDTTKQAWEDFDKGCYDDNGEKCGTHMGSPLSGFLGLGLIAVGIFSRSTPGTA